MNESISDFMLHVRGVALRSTGTWRDVHMMISALSVQVSRNMPHSAFSFSRSGPGSERHRRPRFSTSKTSKVSIGGCAVSVSSSTGFSGPEGRAMDIRKCWAVIISTGLFLSASLPTWAACSDPPGPGVDWRGCDKRGIDLEGANMRAMNLEHTNLMGANLFKTDMAEAYMWSTYLWEANLAGANLRNARLSGAYFRGAYLVDAIWEDGHVCGPDSYGECE